MAGGTEVYEVGDQVGLRVSFGSEEDPYEPSQVIVRIRDPEGRTADLRYGADAAVTNPSPGTYQVVVAATIAGRWRYRFIGMGRQARAEHDGYFDVFDLTTA